AIFLGTFKGSRQITFVLFTLSAPLVAYKVGGCVVGHPPDAQVFLRLRQWHVCVYVYGFHRLSFDSMPDNRTHNVLRSWRLQLSNNVSSGYPFWRDRYCLISFFRIAYAARIDQ